jgi:broad specificity phosphatase PhoE
MGQQDVEPVPISEPEAYRVAVEGPRRVFSSPLARATAAAAVLFPGEDVTLDGRLMERAVGSWEGLDHETVRARWPNAFVDGLLNPLAEPPNGESVAEFGGRVRDFLIEVGRRPDLTTAVVTHNGWIRMAMLLAGEITQAQLFESGVPFMTGIPFQADLA